MARSIALLILLGNVVAHAAENDAKTMFRQVSRHLQANESDNPCAIPFEQTILPMDPLSDGSPLHLFRPSYVETCVSSFQVNQTLMAMHISNLQETFVQYYVFYNAAKDVAASVPLSYQPELGYTLFSGPMEGQTNLDASMSNLLESVNASSEGSTLATFWEIQTSFNKLYDAHVILPTLTGVAGEVAGFHLLEVIPARNLKSSTRKTVQDFLQSYDKDGNLEFTIVWEAVDGNTTEDKVKTFNGMTPYEFYLDLISKPEASLNFPYQSTGARMNGAFRRAKPGGLSIFSFGSWSNPMGILPETFPVTYESGEEETYYSSIEYNSNATSIYALLNSNPDVNEPGAAFTNFEIAVGQWQDAEAASGVKHLAPTPKTSAESPPQAKQQATKDDAYEFDQVINLQVGRMWERRDVAAFAIEEDYAVLKIQSFNFQNDDQGNLAMIEIWSNFTAAAKAKGVTKAIIDVSRNGGGIIASGLSLVACMYPYVPYSLFQNQFDITYNSVMLAFQKSVIPVLNVIRRDIVFATDTELQASIDTFIANDTIEMLNKAILSLFHFCCGGEVMPCNDPTCQELANLGIALDTLKNFPSVPQLRTVINELIVAFEQYNPFNVLGTLHEGDVDPDQIYPVNRGGVQQNLTNQFTELPEDAYYKTVARAFQNQWMFDEYILVSDGLAGSTSCMFTSMIMQLWNNRDQMWNGDLPPTPLTTVTYGGTKDPADTTVAGFPASVQNVKIEVPIITSGLLYMLELVLPAESAESVHAANKYYQTFLPVPPYFAEGLPQMPVYNYYSNWMQPGAIPLQFVRMTADTHIPQIFNGNSLADSSDLAALYALAAKVGPTYSVFWSAPGSEVDDSTAKYEFETLKRRQRRPEDDF